MSALKKAVLPVAGLGTRGLPFTKEVPKELTPILDTPAILYIVEEVIAAGIQEIVFVTSKGKSSLEDFFDPSPQLMAILEQRGKRELAEKIKYIGEMCQVISVRQKMPLGLGHAVLCAAPVVGKEPFVVCLGDEIFPPWKLNGKPSLLQRLMNGYEKTGQSVVGVVEVPKEDTVNYGMIDVAGKKLENEPVKVLKTVEKPSPDKSPSLYGILGRYVFTSEILDKLRDTKPGRGGEIQLTDAMNLLAADGRLQALKVEELRYDVGNPWYNLKAQIDSALRRSDIKGKLLEYMQACIRQG